jgi:hypothetical protein
MSMKSTAGSLEIMRLGDMREEDKDRLIQRLQVSSQQYACSA